MNSYRWVIIALWLVLLVYWAIAAARAKPSVGARRWSWGKDIALRAVLLALVVIGLRVPALRRALRISQGYLSAHTIVNLFGLVGCTFGIAVAVVARFYLGRNWGMPGTRKAQPELITGGPYALVRHPIYAGLIMAMLGSTLALSVVWLLPLALFGSYFLYSARREERLMLRRFPDRYPGYVRRTGMLFPCVLRLRRGGERVAGAPPAPRS